MQHYNHPKIKLFVLFNILNYIDKILFVTFNKYLYLTVCFSASAINRIPWALASATANRALASP